MLPRGLGVLLVLVFYTHLPSPAKGQPSKCQVDFLARFRLCLSERTLNPDHFLWLTRNRTAGSQPPNPPSFTDSACRRKEQLGECFKNAVGQAENTSECRNEDENIINRFYREVIIAFDKKCVHPCRDKLVPSLAECFTSADVNAALFLSNVTLAREQMLGNTDEDVDMFCEKREEILECMRMKTAQCPDTPDVLSAAGLDVEAMNHTVAMLCDNRQLYLYGVRCSVNHSMAEEKCRQTLMRDLSDLETQFQTRSIERNVFAVDICRLRLDHIRCDLNAITERDNDTKCPDEVVGLRREQECAMIPADCRDNFKDRVMDWCDPVRFLKYRRLSIIAPQSKQTSGGAMSTDMNSALMIAMAAAASVWVFFVSSELKENIL